MKFHSRSVEEHAEVPLADEGRLEALVAHWEQRRERPAAPGEGTPCYVLCVVPPDQTATAQARLAEITGLVAAQGDQVAGAQVHTLSKPDPRTLIRSGVAESIGEAARAHEAAMLVVDAELTPSQTRNLEDALGLPICDREAVILNVFERNATTRRARIQVEIAHLSYLRPRIRGIGLNMDQQMGGSKYARGAGETASELLARRIDSRLSDLRRGLQKLKQSDLAQRKHRAHCQRVALVGYTNAGKTSLMNALTGAGLSARDQPFETLDATSRNLTRHGGDVLLSDTVGFIRRLPERLFASFESTLAEVTEASLLLLVVDASDPEAADHLATTQAVLNKLGAGRIPRLVVFNKVDRLDGRPDPEQLQRLAAPHPVIALSTRDPDAVAALRARILDTVRARHATRTVFVPYAQQDIVGTLYARCRVRQHTAGPRGSQFVIEGEPHILDQLQQTIRSRKA